METLPAAIIAVLCPFADAFSARVWEWAKLLAVGAILAPGQRTVTAILRVMGLSDEARFQHYHRVLNRARWSSRSLSHILLRLLVQVVVPGDQPLMVGLDETIERRRGAKIAAKGIYRDPVRSSKSHFVKTSGLRWMAMMVLVPIPWADRVWALPFLTVLAPSERSAQEHERRHKTLPVWGRQMIRQLRRWLPNRVLGVETQRQWADLAILRTTPALFGLFSLVTLAADALLAGQPMVVREAAWYTKPLPTFVDALSLVRQQLWPCSLFSTSAAPPDLITIPRSLFDRFTDTLAYSA
ncbi:MAG: transposase [Dehalococcoidia bacterium]